MKSLSEFTFADGIDYEVCWVARQHEAELRKFDIKIGSYIALLSIVRGGVIVIVNGTKHVILDNILANSIALQES